MSCVRYSPCCCCSAQARFHPADGDLHRFAYLTSVPNFTESTGRAVAVYLCITGLSRSWAAPKSLERRQAAASKKSDWPLKPASPCWSASQCWGRIADHNTPLQHTGHCSCICVAWRLYKTSQPTSLCERSKCCLPSMMCSLGLEVVTEFYLLYIAPKPNQIMQCKARQPRGSSGTHRSSVCMARIACDAFAVCY